MTGRAAANLCDIHPRWPVRPLPFRSAKGVICYAPEWDAVVCVPCQSAAGRPGLLELGPGVRPATSDDIARLGCCSSCGRDLSQIIATTQLNGKDGAK